MTDADALLGRQHEAEANNDREVAFRREGSMPIACHRVELTDIAGFRDIYRHEMNCQIIHDSIHTRSGWTHEYLLTDGEEKLGYGSIAVSGPWRDTPTVYEFFVLPQHRTRVFELFDAFLAATQPTRIETQSNDSLLNVMLHAFAHDIASESILFHDRLTTRHPVTDVQFRRSTANDAGEIQRHQLDPEAKWLVTLHGVVVAAGDILFHYNRPYGDIYTKVAEPYQKRGLGTFLVEALKRVCYEGGSIPAARCNPTNFASRKTLQKAGFVPCGHILKGVITS